MDDFLKDASKSINIAIERLLRPYGITVDNAHEFKDRVKIICLNCLDITKRRYYLDGKYIGTMKTYIDTDFEDLHVEYVVEIIYENLEGVNKMDFKTELEEVLRRYVPVMEDKEQYDNIIKLIIMKANDLHEKYKED